MPATFDIGDVVVLSTEVRNRAGVLATPGAITLRYREPNASTSTAVVPTNDGTGLYSYELSITLDGLWVYRWTTTGAAASSDEREFFVRPRRVN